MPLLLLLCLAAPLCASAPPPEPYDSLFDTAVEAYYRGDWLSVILNMEKALRNKAAVRSAKAHCRIGCANHSASGAPGAGGGPGAGGAPGAHGSVPGAGSVDDLGFFQKILQRADCVNSCESAQLGVRSRLQAGEDVELEFRKRTPYNYLQVAYFKVNKLDKAVAAAYTFFQANPDHVEMRQNLDYYRMMAGVQEEDFKDLEARPHMAEFLLGKQYYSDDLFAKAAAHFEAAVDEYFTADRECRALCEGAYRYDGYNYMEYSADLYQTVTDHYMQVLNCKQQCSVELASAAGRDKPFEDFLPSHFNYLQFSYYNSEKYEQAIECAKTFLLFHPQDEVMNQNLNYYSAVLGEEKARSISARQAVQQFIQRSILEKELLYFGYEAFGITFVDPDAWTPEDVMPQKLRDKQKADKETAARITEEIGNLMKEIEILVEEKKKDSSDMATIIAPREGAAVLPDGVSVSMTARQLNGSQRVLLDAVIGQDECRELQRLSNAAAQKGDGYRGQPSPHTPSESFQGVTVLRAVKLAQEGKIPLKGARLFFDISEKVRKMLESYFLLSSPLYFSYSHLVCRSAIDEKQKRDPDDLSHPVHVDNCVLVSEINECVKDPLYYTYRDYSAILYLNEDFEGGEFIFTELDAKTVTAEVRPRCGRVVGFGAGKENPHGVRAVTRGQRCAVALWFTLDPVHEEKERIQAQDMLKMFSTPLNSEFSLKETGDALESKPLTAEGPPQAAQAAVEKQGDTPRGQKAHNTQEEKPTNPSEQKTVSKATTKTKAAPQGKASTGDKTKAKTAGNVKPAAKKGGKHTEKAQAKQVDKTEAKSATKQTVVSEKDPPSGSQSQSGKEEL